MRVCGFAGLQGLGVWGLGLTNLRGIFRHACPGEGEPGRCLMRAALVGGLARRVSGWVGWLGGRARAVESPVHRSFEFCAGWLAVGGWLLGFLTL